VANNDVDLYELESGLQDFDYVMKGCRFATDQEYNNGETVLLIVEDGQQTLEDGEVSEKRQFWPCGKGWEAAEGGKSVRHESGKVRKFNANSAVGKLLASALEAGAGGVMRKRGSPMEVSTWEGLDFHMTNKQETYKIDGEERNVNRTVVDSFNGEGKKAAAKKTTAKAKKADVDEDESGEASTNGAIPKALQIKLKKKAAEVLAAGGDFDQFMEDAFDIDGVSGNDEAEGSLEEVWATAGGEA
jgi:hypothetical protein